MPINLNLEPNANLGKILLRWDFQEFRRVERPAGWWIVAGLVAGALVVYGLITANFLFAMIILIAAVLFLNEFRRQPRRLDCQITSAGVSVGKKFWRWRELRNYWIAYHPPEVMNFYLLPKNAFDPRVTVPLAKTNPLALRQLLNKYLEEDLTREDEPTSEALSRMFKLQ